MTGGDAPGPGRFLHVCYCTPSCDESTQLFAEALGMHEVMRTSGLQSGAALGLERAVDAEAAFIFDSRGPRVGPAIELLEWRDPPLVGLTQTDEAAPGLRGLGFFVQDLEETRRRLDTLGCTQVADCSRSIFGPPSATLIDRNGLAIDLVSSPEPGDAPVVFGYARLCCAEIAVSEQWHRQLGFVAVAREAGVSASSYGATSEAEGVATRLRLPEEPFELVLTEWPRRGIPERQAWRPNTAGLSRVALRVDDTRASYEQMTAGGWDFYRPPIAVTLVGAPTPEMWVAVLVGPDRVPFELVERPRSAFR